MSSDRCPGVLRLHEAADGWMARVRLPGGRLAPGGTRRDRRGGSVRQRAGRADLPCERPDPRAAPRRRRPCRDAPETAGLLPSLAHDRVRNILASPLAGRHPDSLTGTDDVVAELDRGPLRGPRSRRASGPVPVRGLGRQRGARRAPRRRQPRSLAVAGAIVFRLHLAGEPTTLTVAPSEAAGLALAGARGFLDLARADGAEAWGLSALRDGPPRLAQRRGGALASARPAVQTGGRLPLGTLAQADGRVAVTVLPPLGRLDGAMLGGLAECSGGVGARCESRRDVR